MARTGFPPESAGGVVLDTSAIVAVLAGEPERERFISLLADADDPTMSAATLVETSIVMLARTGPAGVQDLDDFLAAAAVRCVALDSIQAHLARDAYLRFGKGRSPAGLNFGDCFAYALARATSRPLLFKGHDFSKTDVQPAAT
jgi:ribonuclease VapC